MAVVSGRVACLLLRIVGKAMGDAMFINEKSSTPTFLLADSGTEVILGCLDYLSSGPAIGLLPARMLVSNWKSSHRADAHVVTRVPQGLQAAESSCDRPRAVRDGKIVQVGDVYSYGGGVTPVA